MFYIMLILQSWEVNLPIFVRFVLSSVGVMVLHLLALCGSDDLFGVAFGPGWGTKQLSVSDNLSAFYQTVNFLDWSFEKSKFWVIPRLLRKFEDLIFGIGSKNSRNMAEFCIKFIKTH